MSMNFQKDLIQISKATGISMVTLSQMSEQRVLQLLMAVNCGDLTEVENLAKMQILDDNIKKISELTGIPVLQLSELSQENQEQLVGQYTMEIGITPDAELKENLIEKIKVMEK